jgi:hypothetical protein
VLNLLRMQIDDELHALSQVRNSLEAHLSIAAELEADQTWATSQ